MCARPSALLWVHARFHYRCKERKLCRWIHDVWFWIRCRCKWAHSRGGGLNRIRPEGGFILYVHLQCAGLFLKRTKVFITQESSLILTLRSLKFLWYYVNTIVYNYYYHLVPYTKPSDLFLYHHYRHKSRKQMKLMYSFCSCVYI